MACCECRSSRPYPSWLGCIYQHPLWACAFLHNAKAGFRHFFAPANLQRQSSALTCASRCHPKSHAVFYTQKRARLLR
ncbi:Uncharacterised protein [Vibrio cholerae]|uniref:Uncharacterized protein n=1 Tax=Vibrio cholerae TaxID=666 RepID=A0A656ANY7_VIBCL|nr:Uncharacterised protein [Vibrio cholerae]